MNLIERMKKSRKTFGYYIENGLGDIKCKHRLKNHGKVAGYKFSESVSNTVVLKNIFDYAPPEIINDDTVALWINESTEKLKAESRRHNLNWKKRKQIKQADKGNEYFANHIKTLSNQLKELKHQTPFSLRMKSPNTYNLLRDATFKMEESLNLLIRVNKEFIPKESE